MKVVIAPDKLKGSLSARAAARAIARGARRALPGAELELCPLADGGEGTLEALLDARGGERRTLRVTGPLGAPVEASWALLADGTAVIEMAQVAGLLSIPEAERDPTRTTTYGVGELVRAALEAGAPKIVVAVGGSGTNDGGAGMAQALGVRFEGASEPLTGADLGRVAGIDRSGRDRRLDAVEVVVACDVDNPLLGECGATRVYARQKGASEEQIETLERGLARLAMLAGTSGDFPGAGAAGGLGFGLVAFAGARVESGAELVLDAVGLDRRLDGARLLITGEGRLDAQSLAGKLVIAAARRAAAKGVPSVALVGAVADDVTHARAPELTAWLSICDRPESEAAAMRRAAELLEAAAENLLRLVAAL